MSREGKVPAGENKTEGLHFDVNILNGILSLIKEKYPQGLNFVTLEEVVNNFPLGTTERSLIDTILSQNPRDYNICGERNPMRKVSDLDFVKIEGQKYQETSKEGEIKEIEIPTQFLPNHPLPIYEAYNNMLGAMEREIGKRVLLESSFRSDAAQLNVFLYLCAREYSGDFEKTLERVQLPGFSEHGNPENPAFDLQVSEGGSIEDTEQYKWLQENAHKYNFYMSYPQGNKKGIMFEPWHWRYGEMNFPNSVELKPFGEEVNVTMSLLGMHTYLPADRGWSFRTFTKTEQIHDPKYIHFKTFFTEYSKSTGIKKFYAPVSSKQNGEILTEEAKKNGFKYDFEIDFGEGITLFRDGEPSFEGCEVKPGEAFVVAPADCLTVTVRSKTSGKMFAAHAGRRSLFLAGRKANVVENLVKSILEANKKDGFDTGLEDLEITGGFGVSSGEHFAHPEEVDNERLRELSVKGKEKELKEYLDFIEENKQRHESLRVIFPEIVDTEIYKEGRHLDLNALFMHMSLKLGIPKDNIKQDCTDTYLSIDENGNYKYYSNRRDRGFVEGSARNLVIIANLLKE